MPFQPTEGITYGRVHKTGYKRQRVAKITAVKLSHMKDLPKEALTDREADRVLESLNPITLEKLYKLAVDNDITNL